MEYIASFIAGAFLAALAAWIIAGRRYGNELLKHDAGLRLELMKEMSVLEGRAAGAERLIAELREYAGRLDEQLLRTREELGRERESRIESVTRLEAAAKSLEEQKTLVELMKTEMTDTFTALSSAALSSSSKDFLRLASEHLGKVVMDTKGRLGEHQAAMDGMIKPLAEALNKYEDQIKRMEESRQKAYGGLEEQLRTLTVTNESLQKETRNLVTALRKPQVRGRWGEMQLRRVAELSGMSSHCDFTEQVSVDTEKGRVRPDMIVHLPSDREIVVDSKVSLEAYLEAVSASTDEERRQQMERHAQQVRAHMNRLASKDYWSQFESSPEFVVLFIPGESFLSAAVEIDRTLIEDGIEKKVIVSTPTTFIALLRAIAFGWRQEQLTQNAKVVSDLGRQLYERIGVFVQHFSGVGSHLEKAVGSYNKAAGSLESRVIPSMRKFRELGVTGTGEIPGIEGIDLSPRTLDQPGDGENVSEEK